MNEAAYGAYVQDKLGRNTVGSYLCYLRRVERELRCDIDQVDLADLPLETIRLSLKSRGVPAKSLSNCISALRSYAAFRGCQSTATP